MGREPRMAGALRGRALDLKRYAGQLRRMRELPDGSVVVDDVMPPVLAADPEVYFVWESLGLRLERRLRRRLPVPEHLLWRAAWSARPLRRRHLVDHDSSTRASASRRLSAPRIRTSRAGSGSAGPRSRARSGRGGWRRRRAPLHEDGDDGQPTIAVTSSAPRSRPRWRGSPTGASSIAGRDGARRDARLAERDPERVREGHLGRQVRRGLDRRESLTRGPDAPKTGFTARREGDAP